MRFFFTSKSRGPKVGDSSYESSGPKVGDPSYESSGPKVGDTKKKKRAQVCGLINSVNSSQVNPDLTWRDVQHITMRNCHVANLRATDWSVNAMGRNYSHSFGYGVMDASGMVTTARSVADFTPEVTHLWSLQ